MPFESYRHISGNTHLGITLHINTLIFEYLVYSCPIGNLCLLTSTRNYNISFQIKFHYDISKVTNVTESFQKKAF